MRLWLGLNREREKILGSERGKIKSVFFCFELRQVVSVWETERG